MSGQRSRLIRRAILIAVRMPDTSESTQAMGALERMKATWKEIRRATRLCMRKIARTAEQLKTGATMPLVLPKPIDIYADGMEPHD